MSAYTHTCAPKQRGRLHSEVDCVRVVRKLLLLLRRAQLLNLRAVRGGLELLQIKRVPELLQDLVNVPQPTNFERDARYKRHRGCNDPKCQ